MDKLHYTNAASGLTWEIKADQDAETVGTALAMVAEAFGIGTDENRAQAAFYLFQNGFKQAMGDSVAQPAANAKDEGTDINAAIKAAADKRLAAIMAGSVSVREGGPRDPIKALALVWLKAKLKEKGQKLGSDKAAIEKKVAEVIERNRDKLEAEIARQKAAAAIDIEL